MLISGRTLAAEKLLELHDLPLGVETLRQWMIADRFWLRRRDRRPRVFQPRPRRALHLVETEAVFGYFQSIRAYLV